MKPAEALRPLVLPKLVTRVENRTGRKVKTFDPETGETTGEKPLAEAVASILAKHHLEVEYEDIKAKREQRERDLARRAQGLPDLCDDCGAELGMSKNTLRTRDAKGHPWACRLCSIKRKEPPDRCDGCSSVLTDSRGARCRRRKKPRPWLCSACFWTPERRTAVGRAGGKIGGVAAQKLLAERYSSAERSNIVRKGHQRRRKA